MTRKQLKAFCTRLAREEHGGEVMEWVLIAGLISIAAIAVVTSVGTKLLARWNTIDGSL